MSPSLKINEKYLRRMTGLKVSVVDSAKSTFDEIGSSDVIIACKQKLGFGRGDHTFFSPPGGIYMVMREEGLNIDAHTLTPAVGLAARDSIKSVLGLDTELKWVNDVMYNGRKAAGILVRSPRRGEYLIGIGVNFSTDKFTLQKAGLEDATSLCAPHEKATDFCVNLIKRIHLAAISPFEHERYSRLCRTVGKDVSFMSNGARIVGHALSVERDGSLLVKLGMATVAVDAGEVSIVREVD